MSFNDSSNRSLSRLKKQTALALTVFACLSASTSQANDFTVGGLLGLTNARVASQNGFEQNGLSTSRKLGLGFGGSLSLHDASAPIGFQLGAWYLSRKFEIGDSTLRVVRTVPTVMIPAEIKLFPGGILSVSGGGFAAIRAGDVSDEVQVGNQSAFSFSSTQRKSTEFGLTAAAEVLVPVGAGSGLVVEGRYWRGLSNAADNSVFDEKIDDFTLMAGLRFPM